MLLEITEKIADILNCNKCYNYSCITDDKKNDYLYVARTQSLSDSSSSQNSNNGACCDDRVEVKFKKENKKKNLISKIVLEAYRHQKIQQKIIKNKVFKYNDIRKKLCEPELSSRNTKVAIRRTLTNRKQTFLTQFSNFSKRHKQCPDLEASGQESRKDQESIDHQLCTPREGIPCSSKHDRSSTSQTRNMHWSKKQLQFFKESILHFNEGQEAENHSWNNINAQMFSVRSGPQYFKNKIKVASKPSLYEVISVRCFSSNQKTHHVADLISLPKLKDDYSSLFPQLLIVHFQLPHEAPNLFRSKDDGIGSEIIFYLRPSSQFLDEIRNISTASPATKLFQKFAKTCTTSVEMRSRFKCIGLIQNLQEELKGLSSWLQPYNGKPVLSSNTSMAREGISLDGIRYLEFTVNVHEWSFLAKKGFTTLLPLFKRIKLNVGFTIEGVNEDELPECILGCAELNCMDVAKLVCIPKELQHVE